MSPNKAGIPPNEPSKEFVDEVKDALEHLYDFPYLEQHRLGQHDTPQKPSTDLPGQYLRKKLLAAIESLSPQTGVPFRSPQARLYNLLQLRYVEGMTVQEAAHELRVSLRQTYRDLRRAEESVAAILWMQQPEMREARATQKKSNARSLSSVETELNQLKVRTQMTGMRTLIKEAQKAVRQLALQRAVEFTTLVPSQSVTISTDPVIARQVLVNLFSHTIQHAEAGSVALRLTTDDSRTRLSLSYTPQLKLTDEAVMNQLTTELVERLGWTVEQKEEASRRTVMIQLSLYGPTVLVVDDNQGLVDLLNHYLSGHMCRVVGAASGREGLQLAQQVMPDAIILDIMMPEMDGWELLQRLRGFQFLAETPIIICSVFNDPELAYSLGASLFLPKPISQHKILTALQEVGVLNQKHTSSDRYAQKTPHE